MSSHYIAGMFFQVVLLILYAMYPITFAFFFVRSIGTKRYVLAIACLFHATIFTVGNAYLWHAMFSNPPMVDLQSLSQVLYMGLIVLGLSVFLFSKKVMLPE